MPTSAPMRSARFHGRYEDQIQECQAPGCDEAGQFRAPGPRSAGFDGPGEHLWFCLDHVREFNARYNYFAGMSADEIVAAQHPASGWADTGTTRAFRADAGVGAVPRWADFADPLDAISARAAGIRGDARGAAAASRFTARERDALTAMDLDPGSTAERCAAAIPSSSAATTPIATAATAATKRG